MKKTLNTFLILAIIFLISGTLFKQFHLTGADILMILGLMIAIPIASILYCVQKFRKVKSVFVLLGFIPVICLVVGMAFLLNHFSFGIVLFYTGLILCGIYLLILLLIMVSNKSFHSLEMADALFLMILFGLIFTGYITGKMEKGGMAMENEKRFIEYREKSEELRKVNQSLFASYSDKLSETKLREETQKVLFTIDTMENEFFRHFMKDNDTVGLFDKHFVSELYDYFGSGFQQSRQMRLIATLQEYVDTLSIDTKKIPLSTYEMGLIRNMVPKDRRFPFFHKYYYYIWGSALFLDGKSALAFLEELKYKVLLTENLLINGILRQKPGSVSLDGIPREALSKKELLQAKQLVNTDSNTQIISYSLVCIVNGDIWCRPFATNKLPDDWALIVNTLTGNKFWIEDIRAVNSAGDTVYLHSITIGLK